MKNQILQLGKSNLCIELNTPIMSDNMPNKEMREILFLCLAIFMEEQLYDL